MVYNAVANAHLTIEGMKEVLLKIEEFLNNWPLANVDNDIEPSILTPNVLTHGQVINVPNLEFDEDNPDIRKIQRCIKRCKRAEWQRWNNDYMKELRRRNNVKCKTSIVHIKKVTLY